MMHVPGRVAASLLAGSLLLFLAAPSFAQARARRPTGAIPTAIVNKLSLTEEQKAKVKAANDTYQTEFDEAAKLTTPKEKRAANKSAREKYETAFKAALTADQQKQLDTLLTEAKDYKDFGPMMGSQMAAAGLTADQKAKVKEINAKYLPELEKLRASQKGATDQQAVRAQIREQQQKMAEEVRAILTPEQRKALGGRRKKQ
jgi:Spy/CpxP family protein refolding chaperone